MSKLFRGNVSIVTGFAKDGTEDIRLKKDVDGVFNSENASELLAKANELSKKHKLPLNTWSFYFPVKSKNVEPVLLADKFGKPKLTMLPPMKSKSTTTKSKKRKLA